MKRDLKLELQRKYDNMHGLNLEHQKNNNIQKNPNILTNKPDDEHDLKLEFEGKHDSKDDLKLENKICITYTI